MKYFLALWKHAAKSQLIVALGAASLTLISSAEHGAERDLQIYLSCLAAAGTCTLYILHRFIGSRLIPSLAEVERFAYLLRHKKALILLLGLSGILAIVSLLALRFYISLWHLLPPIAFGLLYALPVIAKKRLRDIAFIKLIAIGIIWAWVTVIWSIESLDMIDAADYLMFAERALFIMALTLPFDIRDMDLDKDQGLFTIATRLGTQATKKIAHALLVICLILLLVSKYKYGLSSPYFIAMSISIGVASILIRRTHKNRPEYYFSGNIDGVMILAGILYIIVNQGIN